MSKKRFRIAFSFAGEKRDFVSKVAAILANKFSEDEILYDKYHEAEFAEWKLGLDLPDLYRDQSDLIVVVVCPDYSEKDWCGLEWVAIHGMLMSGKSRDAAELNYREALRIARAVGYADGEAYITGNLASLALDRKDWLEAETQSRKALPLSEKLGRQELIAHDCRRLAKALVRQGKGNEGYPTLSAPWISIRALARQQSKAPVRYFRNARPNRTSRCDYLSTTSATQN